MTKITQFKLKLIIFSNIKNIDATINQSIEIHFIAKTTKYKIDWTNVIKVTNQKPKNLPKMNSYLLIGLLKIKNVFHSISLNNNWLHTNKTHTNQNISIIEIPKSVIIFWSSQILNFQKRNWK